MDRDKFLWKVEHGDDIMFDVVNRHFVIFTWDDAGIRIVEQNVNSDGVYFQTAEELIDHYLVNGKPLKDLVNQIIITSYTQVRE